MGLVGAGCGFDQPRCDQAIADVLIGFCPARPATDTFMCPGGGSAAEDLRAGKHPVGWDDVTGTVTLAACTVGPDPNPNGKYAITVSGTIRCFDVIIPGSQNADSDGLTITGNLSECGAIDMACDLHAGRDEDAEVYEVAGTLCGRTFP